MKLNGGAQKPNLYYPFCEDDGEFATRMLAIGVRVGPAFSGVIADARKKHKMWLSHIILVKQLSNSAKHWSLSPTTSSACGVAYFKPDKSQSVVEIPGDHFTKNDEFTFQAVDADPAQPVLTLIQFRIEGIATKANCDPTTIFSSTSAHLRDVVENAEKLLGSP